MTGADGGVPPGRPAPVAVCAVGELPDGGAIRVPADRTGTADAIAVFHDGGRFYALDDTCPHAEASLAEGFVADGEVECALHGRVFCLRTGAAIGWPASESAVAHRVEVRHGTVWLSPDVPPEG